MNRVRQTKTRQRPGVRLSFAAFQPSRTFAKRQRTAGAQCSDELATICNHEAGPLSGRVSIVVPVYNEERVVAGSIERLLAFLDSHGVRPFEIVIAENGSTDRTLDLAQEVARADVRVSVVHLEQKGRGGALKTAWLGSAADILSYMDADLSTDLSAFPRVIEPLLRGECDIVTGSRLLHRHLTDRCIKREIVSRGYNWLLRMALGLRVRDAQCGFKAVTRQAARELLPMVENTNWFFDTELLVVAQRLGYRIREIPVQWVENRNTHVRILPTALEDILGVIRLLRWYRLDQKL